MGCDARMVYDRTKMFAWRNRNQSFFLGRISAALNYGSDELAVTMNDLRGEKGIVLAIHMGNCSPRTRSRGSRNSACLE